MRFRKTQWGGILTVVSMAGLAGAGLAGVTGMSSTRAHAAGLAAVAPPIEITLVSSTRDSDQPLTTEKVSSLDPKEWNAHRRMWVIERKASISELQVGAAPKPGTFGIKGGTVTLGSTAHLRGEGPWFGDLVQFSCGWKPEREPFATREGSRRAAQEATRQWSEILEKKRLRLSVQMQAVQGASESEVREKASQVFQNWLHEAESLWRVQGRESAAAIEWKFYRDTARCGTSEKTPSVNPSGGARSWRERMEPASSQENKKLLARAPARRWNGTFSVRVSFDIGGKVLVGQFLVDTETENSFVSAEWLRSQGIVARWIALNRVPSERVSWGATTLWAKPIEVDSVTISGLKTPLRRFFLMDTGVFGFPENRGACCDGVLGLDFFKHYAVEFVPNGSPALMIYSPTGFSPSESVPWTEMAVDPSGGLVSECEVNPNSPKTEKISGVRWDTGSEIYLSIHRPWQQVARVWRGPFQLSCGNTPLASGIRPAFPTQIGGLGGLSEFFGNKDEPKDTSALKSRYPGVSVGAPLLARGRVIFDLPHGRLWFPGQEFGKQLQENATGLSLKFAFRRGERVLEVTEMRADSRSAELAKSGVKNGTVITHLDEKSVDQMDIWEVSRRLSGDYGTQVGLRWNTPKGGRVAVLTVR